MTRLIPALLLACAIGAHAAQPVDGCTPPTDRPDAPSDNALAAAFLTIYERSVGGVYPNGTPISLQFWREACPDGVGSLLWIRLPCDMSLSNFAILQAVPWEIVEHSFSFTPYQGTRCTGYYTYLVDQDSRLTMFRNNGEVILLHRGSVMTWATLPAVNTSAAGYEHLEKK